MGYGDEIIATGMAKGARARGKRIAFGDGKRIMWSHTAEPIYRYNPNIALPGSEGATDLEWVHHYKHNRIYFHKSSKGNAWEYDPEFRVKPGEIYFDKGEKTYIRTIHPRFILIEPKVKSVYPNKQWPIERYQLLAKQLVRTGYRVCQFVYDTHYGSSTIAQGVRPIPTKSFRQALAALSQANLYIGPEGGLVHGAAAFGIKSVVLFGGFTDPKILGYSNNVNLTGGASPCGSLARCQHCQDAMRAITVDQVYRSALELLK